MNLSQHSDAPEVTLIPCGAQAPIPIVAAISGVARLKYAETCRRSRRAPRGQARARTSTSSRPRRPGAWRRCAASEAKAIIILNPAEPPIVMRTTIYAEIDDPDPDAIDTAIRETVADVAAYVPGYRLTNDPLIADGVATVIVGVEVEGAGDNLPPYAGNLDIMTSAVRVPVIVRCAPAFAAVLSGAGARTPAAAPQGDRGVLVVCGSFVAGTTAQLERLARAHPETLVAASVGALAGAGRDDEVERVSEAARSDQGGGGVIRRLDHLAVAVADTEAALRHFRDRLGLEVVAVDEPPEVPVGRGRPAGFPAGDPAHGARIECTTLETTDAER